MTSSFDTLVIGAGAMGCATAYHLARAGQRVLLLEQFALGHARGSSHGESRIFRFAYDRPHYAQLAMQCRPLWRALEAETGERLLYDTGGLDLAESDSGRATVEAVAAALAGLGCAYQWLDAADLARRYPQWRLAASAVAVYSPDAGVLHPSRCVHTLAARAAAHGAAVHEHEPALRIEPAPDSVEVVTAANCYRARRLVLTAGAWARALLQPLGVELPLQVTQEQVVYFRPRAQQQSFAFPHFPLWIYHDATPVYGMPILERPAMKVAFHHDGPVIPVADLATDRQPRPAVTERLHAFLCRCLPAAAGQPVEALTCLYTNTPDHDFIVDALPRWPHLLLGSPCSGHGFKFAIGIGRALADLALHGQTEMAIGSLGIGRFLSGGDEKFRSGRTD